MSKQNEKDCCTDALSDAFFKARKSDLQKRLGHKRFEHTLGVAETAEHLASTYDVDVRKARLAGLLHDWDKDYDNAGIRARVAELEMTVDPYISEEMPWLLHGPTAAMALVREFACLPHDVAQAIERHTAGAVDMADLDMVVYVADALEPGRDFAGLDELRALVGKVSLEELFLATFRQVLLNLVERRKRLHPQSIEIWNHYLARAQQAAGNQKGKKGKA